MDTRFPPPSARASLTTPRSRCATSKRNLGFGQLAVERAVEHGVVGVDGVAHIGQWVERTVAHDLLFAEFICTPNS